MVAEPVPQSASHSPGGGDGLAGESYSASECWRSSEATDHSAAPCGPSAPLLNRDAPENGLSGDPGMDAGTTALAPLRPRRTGPSQFLLKLSDQWGLSQEELVSILGFAPARAAHVASVLGGWAEFGSRDVRDRIVHLYRIRETLDSLLRDLEVEREWLREPHDLLGGRSPMFLLLGGSMEDLLLVREYVDEFGGL